MSVNRSTVRGVVQYYEDLKDSSPIEYSRTVGEYRDMAHGGNAGKYNFSTLRETYYKGYPDYFFKLVLEGLGEVLEAPIPVNP